jgi:hypothetical protein
VSADGAVKKIIVDALEAHRVSFVDCGMGVYEVDGPLAGRVPMLNRVAHKFVDVVPEHLDEGVVYVCIPYETVVHACCCGCLNEVVTPPHPLQWSVTFNGEAISLSPVSELGWWKRLLQRMRLLRLLRLSSRGG